MTSRLIPQRVSVGMLRRLRLFDRLRLWLDVFQRVLRHGDWVLVIANVQRHPTVRPYLRDLCHEPAPVAALGFSISHHGYLGRGRISTR